MDSIELIRIQRSLRKALGAARPLGRSDASVKEAVEVADLNRSQSFLASLQEFHFSRRLDPRSLTNEFWLEKFFSTSSENPFQMSAIDAHTYQINISNFYPKVIRPLVRSARLSGSAVVRVRLNESAATPPPAVEDAQFTFGYEFIKHRGLPRVFASGPGTFEYSIQLYGVHENLNKISLFFFASPRPKRLVNLGPLQIYRALKSMEHRLSLVANITKETEKKMVNIHNRCHREFIDYLLNDQRSSTGIPIQTGFLP